MEVRSRSAMPEPTSGSKGSTLVRKFRDSKPTMSWGSLPPLVSSKTPSLSQTIRTCVRSLAGYISRAAGNSSISRERMDFATTWSKRLRETESTTTLAAQEWAKYEQRKLSMAKALVNCGMPWSVATSQLNKLLPMPPTKQD